MGGEIFILENVCSFRKGKTITKKQTREGDMPVISGSVKPSYYHDTSNREGETIAVASSGTAGFVSYWDQPVYLSDSFSIHPDEQILRTKYVFYFLKSRQNDIYQKRTGGGVPHIYPKDLAKFKIPIPSIKKQNHIVSILDKFSMLTEDLSVGLPAEHNARRKQYEHYRDKLLNFKILRGGVILIELGMVADILNGYNFKSSTYSSEGIRVIRISDVQKGKISNKKIVYYPSHKKEDYKKQLLKENDLVMSLTGNVGRVAMLSKSNLPAGLNQRVACIRTKTDVVMSRFLYHYFNQDKFESLAIKRSHGAGQKNLSTKWLSKFKIPISTINDQKRVVGILDRFDTLINDLSTGLPAEQKARRKQYEYYREKLLTFSI